MFERLAGRVAALSGRPGGLALAIGLSLLGWATLGVETTVLLVTLVTWWQLFPLQFAQAAGERRLHAKIDQLVRDLPEVDSGVLGEDGTGGR